MERNEKLEASMNRLQEAHFYLHEMEAFYYQADPSRWRQCVPQSSQGRSSTGFNGSTE